MTGDTNKSAKSAKSQQSTSSSEEIRKARILAVNELRESSEAVAETLYRSASLDRTTTAQILQDFEQADQDLASFDGQSFALAGRLMQVRRMGKSSFAQLADSTGQLQIYCNYQQLGADIYDDVVRQLDRGDIVWVQGCLMVTRTGELSLSCDKLSLVAKCLQPLPEKFHGIKDIATRYRRRELDMLMSPQTRSVLAARSYVNQAMRRYLEQQDYLEVETPMMHDIPSGAAARPFETRHLELDKLLHLRISPELALKRLLVGGQPKVFEINRCFRNEGVSSRHNPEFTTIEIYTAWTNYLDAANLTEALVRSVANHLTDKGYFDNLSAVPYQGEMLDFAKPFRHERIDVLVAEALQVDLDSVRDPKKLLELVDQKGLLKDKTREIGTDWGKTLLALFETLVEPTLIQPTFVTHHPTSVSPLSACDPTDPRVTERWELFISGMECANGFSELNDPQEQLRRFEQQESEYESGNDEAMRIDHDYIQALEYGMPCAGGIGIGIDRVVMLMTDSASIKDVLYFPYMR